jgi:hypothetical protein
MKLEDVGQIKTSLTVLYNDKQKAMQNKKKGTSLLPSTTLRHLFLMCICVTYVFVYV